jgi:Cdc6-like AAA superfamily ATPase
MSAIYILEMHPDRQRQVYGPNADQALIYNDLVFPLLQDVLQGYNVTCFVYGTTGTGKTHTMQGDLTPSLNNVRALRRQYQP